MQTECYFLLHHISTHLGACCCIHGASFIFALVLFLHFCLLLPESFIFLHVYCYFCICVGKCNEVLYFLSIGWTS